MDEIPISGSDLHCPHDGSDSQQTASVAPCRVGGSDAPRVAANSLDFPGDEAPWVRQILDWPEDFVHRLGGWTFEAAAGGVDDAFRAELVQHGLVDASGLTPLGRRANYDVSEYAWQRGNTDLGELLVQRRAGEPIRVLDVGCGAGQTLRLLQSEHCLERTGVDVDPLAIALGTRFAAAEGIPVRFIAASAYTLPFADATFDVVLARLSLNYMQQSQVLRELVRVLRPGGALYGRVERVWHDLMLIRGSRSFKALVCRLRDLGIGVAHELSGWQPRPGRTFTGGRAFASAGRLRRHLMALGCFVTRVSDAPNCPRVQGRAPQLIVVARKADRSDGVLAGPEGAR